MKKADLEIIYHRLFNVYGSQNWWPADSPFEVMVGAVLTQNTAWKNVEKAINNLKAESYLDVDKIVNAKEKNLARLIRPSGYFNVKTKRLKNLCRWYKQLGEYSAIENIETDELRNLLLEVNGIGPETADDILLYAFSRPVFVIDVYTRRLFSRLGLIDGDEDYETLRNIFETGLIPDTAFYNEYHALIVRHAKEKCNQLPDCRHCKVEAPVAI